MSEENETEHDDEKEYKEKLEKSKTHAPCEGDECELCSMRDCPRHEPLHYHHDGCPACWSAPKNDTRETVFITVHCKRSTNCKWHDEISGLICNEFGGVRTLWNHAWIEYKLYRNEAEKAAEKLRKMGHEVDVE